MWRASDLWFIIWPFVSTVNSASNQIDTLHFNGSIIHSCGSYYTNDFFFPNSCICNLMCIRIRVYPFAKRQLPRSNFQTFYTYIFRTKVLFNNKFPTWTQKYNEIPTWLQQSQRMVVAALMLSSELRKQEMKLECVYWALLDFSWATACCDAFELAKVR